MLWWTVLHRDWRDRPRLMVVYFAGLIALMAALVIIAPCTGSSRSPATSPSSLLPGACGRSAWPRSPSSPPPRRTAALPDRQRGLDRRLRAHHHRERRRGRARSCSSPYVGEQGHQRRRRSSCEELEATLARERGAARAARRAGPRGGVRRRAPAAWRARSTTRSPRAWPGSSPSSRRPSRRATTGDGAGTWTPRRELARESLTEARRSVQALRPEPLEDARLPEALADVAGAGASCTGVRGGRSRRPATDAPLPPESRSRCCATAQEALANVARHAGAGGSA